MLTDPKNERNRMVPSHPRIVMRTRKRKRKGGKGKGKGKGRKGERERGRERDLEPALISTFQITYSMRSNDKGCTAVHSCNYHAKPLEAAKGGGLQWRELRATRVLGKHLKLPSTRKLLTRRTRKERHDEIRPIKMKIYVSQKSPGWSSAGNVSAAMTLVGPLHRHVPTVL
jgi:hypothetical protein